MSSNATISRVRERTAEPGPAMLLDALPHPVILIDANGHIAEANAAAETFFQASTPVLRRSPLAQFVPFGSPLLALIDHVRRKGAAVNEYRVDIGTPRIGAERVVDIYASPVHERP